MSSGFSHRVVCLTPVRNEAWILPAFLAAASIWADTIIVVDQGSTDGSLAIARSFPKVMLIENPSGTFSEIDRQRLLIAAARRLEGPRILVALDADEFLSPALATPEWFARLAAAGPGACAYVPFFNVRPGLKQGWVGHRNFLAGWVDDGRPHTPEVIHSRRLPATKRDPVLACGPESVALHWQFVAPGRMRSKHRWYLVWERLNQPGRPVVDVYRQYHHMNAISRRELEPVPPEWLSWYSSRGVDLAAIADDGRHWWDADVLARFEEHGAAHFAREAIWYHDWRGAAAAAGIGNVERFADPRTIWQKAVHAWLRFTQPIHHSRPIRLADRLLRPIF